MDRNRIKWIVIFCVVAAVLAGFFSAAANAMDARQTEAIDKFWANQEECQGGIPGTAAMEHSCQAVDEARSDMIEAGLCWGHENQPGVYKRATECANPAAYETIMGMSIR